VKPLVDCQVSVPIKEKVIICQKKAIESFRLEAEGNTNGVTAS